LATKKNNPPVHKGALKWRPLRDLVYSSVVYRPLRGGRSPEKKLGNSPQ